MGLPTEHAGGRKLKWGRRGEKTPSSSWKGEAQERKTTQTNPKREYINFKADKHRCPQEVQKKTIKMGKGRLTNNPNRSKMGQTGIGQRGV